MAQKRLREILAEAIRTRRGDRSQRSFARTLGVSKTTLLRIEMADQNVTIDTLETICRRLRCSVADLLDDHPKQR